MRIHPTLGLMGLTNITQALDEFNNVRVLNQPLGGAPPQQAPSSNNSKLSVGLEILIGLIGFFALCVSLFGLKWFMTRRQWKKQGMADMDGGKKGEGEYRVYQLTRRNSQSSDDAPPVSTLRTLPYHSYAMRKEKVSEYTFDSNGTRVEADRVEEFGEWKIKYDHSPPSILDLSNPWNPYAANRDTIVGTDAPLPDSPTSPDFSHTIHRRTLDEIDGMAGVGTVARGSQIVTGLGPNFPRSDNANRNSSSLGSRDEAVAPSWRFLTSHEHLDPDTVDVVDIH
ncbi:hypothetical protein EDD22DRAFT_1025712 [Suillus occidentalis]|nr:hypothetical protein EDD22DRAFT_1025712 [Suillus occidentalis]